jgi:hypothetical protein
MFVVVIQDFEHIVINGIIVYLFLFGFLEVKKQNWDISFLGFLIMQI